MFSRNNSRRLFILILLHFKQFTARWWCSNWKTGLSTRERLRQLPFVNRKEISFPNLKEHWSITHTHTNYVIVNKSDTAHYTSVVVNNQQAKHFDQFRSSSGSFNNTLFKAHRLWYYLPTAYFMIKTLWKILTKFFVECVVE